MSTLTIEERIDVDALPERVFAFLLDPAQVARCLPGAQLDGNDGESGFLGRMKVKVGPVLTEFRGKASFTEVDAVARRVVLTGSGEDKAGGGSARMVLRSRVEAVSGDAGGGSIIFVTAEVDLAGKLVRLGRGMIDGVSKQLFKQFAERARTHLQAAVEPAVTPAAPVPPDAAQGTSSPPMAAEPAGAPAAASETPASPVAAESVPGMSEPAVVASPPSAAESPVTPPAAEPSTALVSAPPVSAALAPPPAAADNPPLDAGALLWATIWDWLKRLFRRLFGRK